MCPTSIFNLVILQLVQRVFRSGEVAVASAENIEAYSAVGTVSGFRNPAPQRCAVVPGSASAR